MSREFETRSYAEARCLGCPTWWEDAEWDVLKEAFQAHARKTRHTVLVSRSDYIRGVDDPGS